MKPFQKYQAGVLAPFNSKNGGCQVDTDKEQTQATVKAFAFGCSGPCDQSRKRCQTPEACERPEPDMSWWQRVKDWFIGDAP